MYIYCYAAALSARESWFERAVSNEVWGRCSFELERSFVQRVVVWIESSK